MSTTNLGPWTLYEELIEMLIRLPDVQRIKVHTREGTAITVTHSLTKDSVTVKQTSTQVRSLKKQITRPTKGKAKRRVLNTDYKKRVNR